MIIKIKSRRYKIVEIIKTKECIKKIYKSSNSYSYKEIAQITKFKNNDILLSMTNGVDISLKYDIKYNKWFQEDLKKYFKNDDEILEFFF